MVRASTSQSTVVRFVSSTIVARVANIVRIGDPILRVICSPVSHDDVPSAGVDGLIAQLFDTLGEIGVGLAAPQVGVGRRAIVVQDLAKFHEPVPAWVLERQDRHPIEPYAVINPELSQVSETEVEEFEGCLSVPGYRGLVPRFQSVRLTGVRPDGREIDEVRSGWHARILQHEVDHLNGKLCIDRMNTRSVVSNEYYESMWRDVGIDEFKAQLVIR